AAPWEQTAQNTYNLIMSIVRWVAIIGVVGCGLAAMFGKLSWDWAGKIIIGLVLIFGGTQIVDYFRSGMGG
ncbi:conjugal transfer protein, partial [Mesorhizobium sp. M7A.T.Ca.US.000.02.1.1]